MNPPNAAAPTARPGRRERRRAEVRERLFRAALALFAERGFNATTVEAITEAADVGKGTFFNYFPAKEHVLGALAQIQLGKVEAAVHEARGSHARVRPVLRKLLNALAEEPGRSPALFRSLVIALQSNEAVREWIGQTLARGRGMLVELFTLGQKRGEIRRDHKPEGLALALQQGFFGTLMLWTLPPASRLNDRLEITFDLFWSGIAAHGASRKERHP